MVSVEVIGVVYLAKTANLVASLCVAVLHPLVHQQCCRFLLLIIIASRMGKSVVVSMDLIPPFSASKRDVF